MREMMEGPSELEAGLDQKTLLSSPSVASSVGWSLMRMLGEAVLNRSWLPRHKVRSDSWMS